MPKRLYCGREQGGGILPWRSLPSYTRPLLDGGFILKRKIYFTFSMQISKTLSILYTLLIKKLSHKEKFSHTTALYCPSLSFNRLSTEFTAGARLWAPLHTRPLAVDLFNCRLYATCVGVAVWATRYALRVSRSVIVSLSLKARSAI